MTPNRAKIVITNPCSEDWNSMSRDAAGRFCQSCQKNVIDFSSKSDEEIKAFLKDKQGEQVCGRFFVHQVERIRIEIDPNLLISGIPFWQKFLAIVLVCFGADFLGCDFVFAQTQTDSVPVITKQLDSLSIEQPTEADSTAVALELTTDSLVIKPLEPKLPQEWQNTYPIICIGPTMGLISIVEEEVHYPEWEIPLILKQPEKDTIVPKLAGTRVSKTSPVVPKHPEKKPALPESAIIADTSERRKTRRS